jgi:hypothetical protein
MQCCKIYGMLKEPTSMKDIFLGKIQLSFLAKFLLLRYYIHMLEKTARELW